MFDGVEVSEGRRSQRNQWVALLMRGGNCTFLDKVRRAEEAGAAAVLIGNFLPNEVCRVVYYAISTVRISREFMDADSRCRFLKIVLNT
jgi:hypothetical protein